MCACHRATTAAARRLVGQLRVAGADMLKTYSLSPTVYSVVAAEARRQGIRFGGHAYGAPLVTPLEASDQGASIVDHIRTVAGLPRPWGPRRPVRTKTRCRLRLWRRSDSDGQGTWFVPTLALGHLEGAGDAALQRDNSAGVLAGALHGKLAPPARRYRGISGHSDRLAG